MPAAVKDALAYAVEFVGGRTEGESKEYIQQMVRDGKLFEECWS